MFVTTGCTTDERLNMAGGQDPRYSKALDPNYNSVSANRIPRYDYKYHYQGENPDNQSIELCPSQCTIPGLELPGRSQQFWSDQSYERLLDDGPSVLITEANATVLRFYAVIPRNGSASQGLGMLDPTGRRWKRVTNYEYMKLNTPRNPYKCYANWADKDRIMNTYTYANSITDKCDYKDFVRYNENAKH
ncbi:MAG: hypothetical protein HETSPECPRED_005780 [Heterodermia speciosa]|uniref:Uncharacterized protein n=1 Tax=Heterodermia speciosa TaxID=116794 RepID=A0A8H3FKS8_9LECA|nr:MAG: hypothetical protein HETSPECPRED_005780 [Heterodermia speciosa]